MKKLISLLLAFCMVFSLAACKQPPVDKADGKATEQKNDSPISKTESTTNQGKFEIPENDVSKLLNNSDLINPEKFAGKKLQIYGYNASAYRDIGNMEENTFIWMVRAAVAEWAALNQVEVEFVGGYDQNVIAGDIKGGGKPDVLLYANKFPMTVVSGVTRPFTDEEYAALAKTVGNAYLDMCKYKGQSYGVVSPWANVTLFRYNKTLFEQYGVKSPKEYYLEGNWNWSTMETCFKEITRDLNDDGKMDIYGSGSAFRVGHQYSPKLEENGKLISIIGTSPEYKDYLEFYYNGHQVSKSLGAYVGMNEVAKDSARPATEIADLSWYDFEHLHSRLDNGDVIETVPVPMYTNETATYICHDSVYTSILSSCDEPEAALSLIHYTLRVGMRYMSDFSLGLYECDYEGIRGACAYSAAWKQKFTEIVAQRMADFNKLTNWDQQMYLQLLETVLGADTHELAMSIPGATWGGYYLDPAKTHPDILLPILIQQEETVVKEFNELYAK